LALGAWRLRLEAFEKLLTAGKISLRQLFMRPQEIVC